MKKIIIPLLLVISNLAISQSKDVKLSNKLVEQYYANQLKSKQKDASIQSHLWLTPILKEAVVNWNVLTDTAKKVFRRYTERPEFGGTEKIYTKGNFKFHYTTNSGYDDEDVDTKDTNGNGVPDYVENMAKKFDDDIYNKYHNITKLTVPPKDGTIGGDALFDIYLSGYEAGDGVYGFVSPENKIGDNPNSTTLTEDNAYTSYMVMRNNYSGFGNEDIALSVTAAHEYMHAVQMGYDNDISAWFMEAVAVWSEDYVYPGYDDNLQFIIDLYGKPDVALNIENGEASGSFDDHWYSVWMFPKYMTEHTDNSIIKNIYERCISQKVIEAVDAELKTNWNSSFNKMFNEFAMANVLMTNNTNFAPYTYSRADVYKSTIEKNGGIKFENGKTPLNYTGADINWDSNTNGNKRLMRLSSDYFTLNATKNFKIKFNPINKQINVFLLKLNNDSFEKVKADTKGEINVNDASNWSTFKILIIRKDKEVTNTDSYNYNFTITKATPLMVANTANVNVKIYPNPATDYINITGINTNSSISIINKLGSVVYTKETSSNIRINTLDMKSGMYFISINNNNKITVKKIIVSH